jgi:DNA repair protein RadC
VVARYLCLRYGRSDQEIMGALFLDSRHRLISESELFRGTLARASVEPRPVLKEGLLRGAAALLLFHTHPSGDPTPSAEDLAFTRRMAEAGEVIGIRLLDHLILGSASRWISLRQRGAW